MTMDLLGWLAAGFMLSTFACRDVVPLRLLALCASVAFIAYGAVADLLPVLALHLVLLPVNAMRLVDALAQHRQAAQARRRQAALTAVPGDAAVMGRPPRDGDDPACVCLAGR